MIIYVHFKSGTFARSAVWKLLRFTEKFLWLFLAFLLCSMFIFERDQQCFQKMKSCVLLLDNQNVMLLSILVLRSVRPGALANTYIFPPRLNFIGLFNVRPLFCHCTTKERYLVDNPRHTEVEIWHLDILMTQRLSFCEFWSLAVATYAKNMLPGGFFFVCLLSWCAVGVTIVCWNSVFHAIWLTSLLLLI